ncbi:MAG: flagellar biosynthesis repressor FlbT [Alphaproteobacteria bacterium]
MALKVELKPHERIVIGGAVVRNGDTRCRFVIEGSVPVMRERDIMTTAEANSPAKRIYFVLQLMYLDRDIGPHRDAFMNLIEEFMTAAPSAWPHLNTITRHVLEGDAYKAIKATRALIDYEQELLSHVLPPERLRQDSDDRNKPKGAGSCRSYESRYQVEGRSGSMGHG